MAAMSVGVTAGQGRGGGVHQQLGGRADPTEVGGVADRGVWLGEALRAIAESPLAGKDRRAALWMVIAASRAAAVPPEPAQVLHVWEHFLHELAMGTGRSWSVATVQAALAKANAVPLARRVQRLARARHSVAHPDTGLATEVLAALAAAQEAPPLGALSPAGGSAQSEGSGAAGVADGDGFQDYFIGDQMVEAEVQTDPRNSQEVVVQKDSLGDQMVEVEVQTDVRGYQETEVQTDFIGDQMVVEAAVPVPIDVAGVEGYGDLVAAFVGALQVAVTGSGGGDGAGRGRSSGHRRRGRGR